MWDGAPFMTPQEGHRLRLRIKAMNDARVDLAILTLTCPNVYWGGAEINLKAAQVMNDDMARARRSGDRIRWMASLPWQYPTKAVAELERACAKGAVGVIVLANVNGESRPCEIRAGLAGDRPPRTAGADASDSAARHA
jgi:aminocarboxymuconate-semialdehyde decarboxylase